MAYINQVKKELEESGISDVEYDGFIMNKLGILKINNKVVAQNGKVNMQVLSDNEIKKLIDIDITKLKYESDEQIKKIKNQTTNKITELMEFYNLVCNNLDEIKRLSEFSDVKNIIIPISPRSHAEIDIESNEIKVIDENAVTTNINKKTNFIKMNDRQINIIHKAMMTARPYILSTI